MPGAPGEDPQTMAQAQPTAPSRRGLTLTQQIFIGLVLGIVAGALVEAYHPTWAVYFRPFSQLFLRLIKMVIAPLIFATLVAGIAGAGHFKVVGRMGLRALIYFEVRHDARAGHRPRGGEHHASRASACNLPMGQQSDITAKAQTWDQILLHVGPDVGHRRDGRRRRAADRRLQRVLRDRARA